MYIGGGGKSGLSGGAIAGIVLGVAAFAILFMGLVGLLLFRRLRTPAAIRAQMARCKLSFSPFLSKHQKALPLSQEK